MLDTTFHALARGFYILAFACFLKWIRALWKRPFPANAPKLVSGYPVVGALQFFFDQNGFCQKARDASATGNYSYYLGGDRVVGLSGPEGRKTFFGNRNLDLDRGSALLIPFANVVETPDDPSIDTHSSHLRFALRTRLLRTQSLEIIPAAMETCISAALKRMGDKCLIDPFVEMKLLYTQSTMAVLGVDEVAVSLNLSKKVGNLISTMEGTFSAIDMTVPWPLNPLHIPAGIAMGRLCVIMLRIIHDQKRQQQQQPDKSDARKENMLQDMIQMGWSTRAILKNLLSSAFASQGNTPTVASWILMGLATDAQWMARVRQEVDQVILKHRKNGEPAEEVLRSLHVNTWEKEFPLLHACLLETVRRVVMLVLTRQNISGADVTIGDTGEVIPPGAYATYNTCEVTWDSDVYPDPQRWDPGRFLSDRTEHLKEALAYTGFGSGRRKCRE
ncbi:hypothetical protein AbraIFM66951_007434 [Aspergillus brasiliensis]|nr:hypothetical protein AbraIFM66951_007434 [Aspergillus brasiliensis]